MIFMLAPGPGIVFTSMPSGVVYESDYDSLIRITNGSSADQAALTSAGCVTLSSSADNPLLMTTNTNQTVTGLKTMIGGVTGLPTPVNPTDAVRKQDLDNIISGYNPLALPPNAVVMVILTALAANTYAIGTAGVGATLTANANGAIAAIDGHTPLLNEYIWVGGEATLSHNGFYKITQVGTVSLPYILTRATFADTAAELGNGLAAVTVGTIFSGWSFNVAQSSATITAGSGIGTAAINVVPNQTSLGVSGEQARAIAAERLLGAAKNSFNIAPGVFDGTFAVTWTPTLQAVVKSIKHLWMTQGDTTVAYHLGILVIPASWPGTINIGIYRSTDNVLVAQFNGNYTPTTLTGIDNVTISGTGGHLEAFELGILWNEIPVTGTIINSATPNATRFTLNVATNELDKRLRVLELSNPNALRNIIPNSALDLATVNPPPTLWNGPTGGGLPVLIAPPDTFLSAIGLQNVAQIGISAPYSLLYNITPLDASAALKYVAASAYVYSVDGTHWPVNLQITTRTGSTGVAPLSFSSSFIQITANIRYYYAQAQLANRTDLTQLHIGPGARITTTEVQVGGIIAATSSAVITYKDLRTADWYGYQLADRPLALNLDNIAARFAALSSTASRPAARNLRFCYGGDSTIWSQGWLGQNTPVGYIEDYAMNTLATTLISTAVTPILGSGGTVTTITNQNHYKGSVLKFTAVGSGVQFPSTGDELSIGICRERGNAGAARIQVFADDFSGSGMLLKDEFSTYNAEPYADPVLTPVTVTLSGDGTTILFPLGQNFTFGHVLTVGGSPYPIYLNPSNSTGGYGHTTDPGKCMVVQSIVGTGATAHVEHYLQFATGEAPALGVGNIVCTFGAGESIVHSKYTIGNIGQGLETGLESNYGVGSVPSDLTQPAGVVSGMGFRETDPRSVYTFQFPDGYKARNIQILISAIDSRAVGATPHLFFNYATNRQHYVMNAGIGGWTASQFDTDTGTGNVIRCTQFAPDVFGCHFGANDSYTSNVISTYVTYLTVPDATVRNADTSRWYHSVLKVGGSYTVGDGRVPITAVRSDGLGLTIGAGSGTLTNAVAVGDCAIICMEDYHADSRRICCRIVTGVSGANITWSQPLNLLYELPQLQKTLSKLVSDNHTVLFLTSPAWKTSLKSAVNKMLAANPQLAVILGNPGIPNQFDRATEGYRELTAQISKELNATTPSALMLYADIYKATRDYTYKSPRGSSSVGGEATLYIDSTLPRTGTNGKVWAGGSDATIYAASGSVPDPVGVIADWLITPLAVYHTVTATGKRTNRLNDGTVNFVGGRKYGWNPAGSGEMRIPAASTFGPTYTANAYGIHFSSNPPTAGDLLEIVYAPNKWALDNTHPNIVGTDPTNGLEIFTRNIVGSLPAASTWALAQMPALDA